MQEGCARLWHMEPDKSGQMKGVVFDAVCTAKVDTVQKRSI